MALYYYFCRMQKAIVFIFCLLLLTKASLAQNAPVRIEFNQFDKTNMAELEMSIFITGGNNYEVSDFPEINSFRKGNMSVKHLPITINNKKETQHIISQMYSSEVGGRVLLPSFDLEVNNKLYRVESRVFDFELKNQPEPIIEIEDVALITQIKKSSVYVGEGFKLSVGFYVSDATTTNWQFPKNISLQVEEMAKKIKPKECLESRLEILKIEAEKQTINGKAYNYYKLFEAVYYPLTKQSINIPEVKINMEKLKNDKPAPQALVTKSFKINCKPLPEHPLKETMPVGEFKLIETMKNGNYKAAGEAFEYIVQIEGTGNLASVYMPELKNNNSFDFFLNTTKLNQAFGREAGSKIFSYKIIPKEKGKFELKSYFNFIYFNTQKSTFDTLNARKSISVVGEGTNTQQFLEKDIYSGIENLKAEGGIINLRSIAKYMANFLLLIMIVFFLTLFKKH